MDLLQTKDSINRRRNSWYKKKLYSNDWYLFIASLIEKSCYKLSNKNNFNSNIIYKKGLKFENIFLQKFRSQGWKVKKTPVSGDQGVDLIASIDDLRFAFNVKIFKRL